MKSLKTNPAQIKIKVCGIRIPNEAEALDNMGVDYIGFNFHPKSPRYLSPDSAKPMLQKLQHAISVGVFVDLPVREVLKIISETGIEMVQLHGHEDADYIAQMPVPVIKAIPHTFLTGAQGPITGALNSPFPIPLHFFLVDTQDSKKSADEFGGSGKTFAWDLLEKNPLPLPYFLAGGLGPDNLAEALQVCKNVLPFAVDLNSKVEIMPGNKDLAKVSACMDIVRGTGA